MITRYTRPEMAKIWSDENRYNCWLEVEILADEAWAELGEIPKEDVEKIRKNAKFTVERILEIEEETRHDVVAFTRCVSESLGEEKKWVHYGLTSTDVVDTAYGYQLKQANDILRKDLADFLEIIKENCQTREQMMIPPVHIDSMLDSAITTPVSVRVGGATVFVLPVDTFLRF